jgi:hypothetical protein
MRIAKILVVCVCLTGVIQAAWAQRSSQSDRLGIPGYLDPRTGAFRPAPQVAEESPDPAAATLTAGTVVVNFTITVKSVLPSTDKIACSVDLFVLDNITSPLSARIFTEEASVAATGTGATRTCKVTIPYSWSLATAASDSVSLSYSIQAPALVTITSTTALPNRVSALSPFATIKVPANGAITTETIAATI